MNSALVCSEIGSLLSLSRIRGVRVELGNLQSPLALEPKS